MTIFLLAPALVFSGGQDAELVSALSAWLKLPVAVLANDEARWPAAEIQAEDPKDRRRLLGTKLKLDVQPATFGLAPAAMPLTLINQSEWSTYTNAVRRRKKPAVSAAKDGRVTFTTQGAAVPLAEALEPAGSLSRPVETHWMFEPVAVHVAAIDCDEARYVRTLADAVGARLVVSKAAYRFDFDPAAYRRRMANRIRTSVAKLPDGSERASLRFDLAVLESLSDRDLKGLFADRERNKDIWFPPSAPMLGAAISRLTWLFGVDGRPARSLADQRLYQRFGGEVEWDRPGGVTWQIHGKASALYVGNKGGKPFHVIL